MNENGFLNVYFEDVQKAILDMQVTDLEGKPVSSENALMYWTAQAEETRKRRGLFFFCGNGASETIAEHLSHDCFQNADFLTQTCSETSHITAISNDISYEDVFSYRIGKVLQKGDMLIAISSSGNSPNIIKAVDTARRQSAYVVTLSGKGADNKLRKLGDLNFYVPLHTYGMVESAHAILMHGWLDCYLDQYKGGRH